MSEWASRPRVIPMAGRRKPTSIWCNHCEVLHRTERAVGGPDRCPAIEAEKAKRREALFAAPHISMPPRTAEKVILRGG